MTPEQFQQCIVFANQSFYQAICTETEMPSESDLASLVGNANLVRHNIYREFSSNAKCCGELILGLKAIELSGREIPKDTLEFVHNWVNDLGVYIEKSHGWMDKTAKQFASAMREWCFVLSNMFQSLDDLEKAAQISFMRGKITCSLYSDHPHLVGDGMVAVALIAERIGLTEQVVQLCQGVCSDLSSMLDLLGNEKYPQPEIHVALYWLEKSAAILYVADENPNAAELEKRTRKARTANQLLDFPSTMRVGEIAKTYLDEKTYLAHTMARILESETEEDDYGVLQEWGTSSRDMEFYRSAMGSHFFVKPMLADVQINYGVNHQNVFDALELAKELKLI